MTSKPRKTTPKKKAVSARASASGKSNGFADVAIRLIDALYDLAQTGNLIVPKNFSPPKADRGTNLHLPDGLSSVGG
ncbi:hypothetical protein, partial [Candidatus Thiosymbion oneisti]|uniref:hypothetical protein n=1 Tax=Candidatus Thiosymbion oneisti TaxID=589554 RepID=UPI001C407F47